MEFFDNHAHLDDEKFDIEREERKFTEIREHLAQMEGEKAAFRKKEVEKELEDIRAAKERLD